MSARISRRLVLGGLAAAATGLGSAALAGCGGSSGSANSNGLRVTSWGDPTKVKLRGQVVDKFNQTHPDVKMKFEGSPVAGYFDKLATQISAGSPPDVINMDSAHMAEYAGRGVIAELDEFKGHQLTTSKLPDVLLQQGVLNNKLYGLPFAILTYGLGYNQTLLDKVNLAIPEHWSYADYADFALEIHKKAGAKVYGSEDLSGDRASFEVWLRTKGLAMYAPGNKKVAFDEATLVDWFSYWSKLRSNGGTTPPDIAAQYKYDDGTGGAIAAKKCGLAHINTNNFGGSFQALTKDRLKLTTPPQNGDGKHGAFPTPSSVMTVSTKCADKKSAAIFIDWFVNSPDAAKILRFISGPPASSTALKALQHDKTTTAEKEIIHYTQISTAGALPAPALAPAGGSQVDDLLLRTSQDLGFGRIKIAAAAKAVVDGANQILTQGN